MLRATQLICTYVLQLRRQTKSPRYNQVDEDYFLLCQEELLKSLKKKNKKKAGERRGERLSREMGTSKVGERRSRVLA